MKTKNLVVEDWDIKFTQDIVEPEQDNEYNQRCQYLYPGHVDNLLPTCDHCGQQHLRYVTWAQTDTLPKPDNWARIGSSCYDEWMCEFLQHTGLFDIQEITKYRKGIVQTPLNKVTWLGRGDNSYFGFENWKWFGNLPYKQLRSLSLPYDKRYSRALFSKPWVVLVQTYKDGTCELYVKLKVDDRRNPETFPANIRAFLRLAPELVKGEVLTGLLSAAGLPCQFDKKFSLDAVETELLAFKRRVHMHLLVELKALVTNAEFSPWRLARLMDRLNNQAILIENLEAKASPKLPEAKAQMVELIELMITERRKDAGFNDWLFTQIDKGIAAYQELLKTNPECLTPGQIMCLAELARREKLGEL